MTSISNYHFKEAEKTWQTAWEEQNVFVATEDSAKPKYYVLEMLPYPSGRIHMGHLRNYSIGDVIARYKLAQGFNVLHPMGWDAFGLPAENAAIANNVHPGKWTYENIDHMRKQLQSIGLSYDWNREIATCAPDYYKHEQKMFLDFLKEGIAYRKESMVNWDPVDETVLANEQVVDGCGWRSGAPIERKKLSQWFLKITDFSEDLLQELENLENWPDSVRTMQNKWIGRSEGLRMLFTIIGREDKLDVYTTRPDTIFGASFCAISPNHPLASELAEQRPEVKSFIEECNKTALSEEAIEKAEKLGIDTELEVKHPFIEGATLPVYIANFILMDYGTGAIFGCPAHDQRDLDFARKYGLSVTPVVAPKDVNPEEFVIENEAYTGPGNLINSEFLNGLSIADAKAMICDKIEERQEGKRTINYRLRDWGVSRQRYWGCPIPIIYCDDCGSVPVPEDQLPVTLPEDVTFDKPGNPLWNHPTWKKTTCPSCGKDAERETDTFDTFFESSWYFARYASPNAENGIDRKAAEYWLPVDQYIGGIEHAVLHLLYSRFFTRALKQCDYLDVKEPFSRLLTQGMVTQETFKDADGKWLFPDEVKKTGESEYVHAETGKPVVKGRIEKMSKSKKNVVDPASIIDSYGADTARLFMLSDSPPDRDLEWSDSGIDGAWRFLNRLWRSVMQYQEEATIEPQKPEKAPGNAEKVQRLTHKTIQGVTGDLDKFHFNRAIARIRELYNAVSDLKVSTPEEAYVKKEGIEIVIQLLNPFVPHIAEEIWHKLGHKTLLAQTSWPQSDSALAEDNVITIAVQVNGKLKATLDLQKDIAKEDAEKAALEEPAVQSALADKEVRKIIVVPNRIINVVAA